MTEPTAQDRQKEAAGRHAASYVTDGMRVGLGTGSTVQWTIVDLGERKPDIVCVATSLATHDLATSLGLHVVAPDAVEALDLAIDGADEVDPAMNLIKGGGGAHTREKIVAAMAPRFVVVVDESKLVDTLGAFGLPVEVVEFGADIVARRLRALGAREVRRRERLSDNGNPILDAVGLQITDPSAFAAELSQIPGIVEHGIFPERMVERVVVAAPGGVRELTR